MKTSDPASIPIFLGLSSMSCIPILLDVGKRPSLSKPLTGSYDWMSNNALRQERLLRFFEFWTEVTNHGTLPKTPLPRASG